MKQMPPRCWARCSTARRSRRGPLGPTISQSAPFGKRVVGQRLAEVLVVDAEVLVRDARLRHAGAAAGLEHVDRLVGVRLGHPAPHRPAAQPLVFERPELVEVVVAGDVVIGSKSSVFARSSQNGHPVAGSKCQRTISRTCASSRSRARDWTVEGGAAALGIIGSCGHGVHGIMGFMSGFTAQGSVQGRQGSEGSSSGFAARTRGVGGMRRAPCLPADVRQRRRPARAAATSSSRRRRRRAR